MRSIAVLGATGSIGSQALDIIKRHPERFRAAVLTAHSNARALFDLVRVFRPQAAGLVVEPEHIDEDVRFCQWYFGPDCSRRAVRDVRPDDALAAVVGVAGLDAVLASIDACERVLLANKEALVTGGQLVLKRAREKNTALLPVDSEHSAIFQCLEAAGPNLPERFILTASGGPFRTWNKSRMENATVEDALGHPTWRMGGKITVDCATMMNKGLEVIEAHYLFNAPEEKISVVVHPESVIHSMVEFADGAVLAQLGAPDMRTAIGYAMGYPDRVPYGGRRLDFAALGRLSFEAPDTEKFRCLALARDALRAGPGATVVLNGANEAAVEAFLGGKIGFGDIARAVEYALERVHASAPADSGAVAETDRMAREAARRYMRGV